MKKKNIVIILFILSMFSILSLLINKNERLVKTNSDEVGHNSVSLLNIKEMDMGKCNCKKL